MARAKPLLAAVAVALAAAASALADDPTVRINPADQAKARAQLLKAADLGTGWTGGARTPDPLKAPSCPGFNPKESDLIVTGHAAARFRNQAVDVDQDVQVMQKASFVRTDFQRSIKPQLAPCLGRLFQQSAGSAATLVSSARVPFPHVGAVSAMFRITAAVTSGGQTANVVIDSVFLGQSRTEYSLTVVAPEVAKSQLVQFETRLARALVARTKA